MIAFYSALLNICHTFIQCMHFAKSKALQIYNIDLRERFLKLLMNTYLCFLSFSYHRKPQQTHPPALAFLKIPFRRTRTVGGGAKSLCFWFVMTSLLICILDKIRKGENIRLSSFLLLYLKHNSKEDVFTLV